MLRKSILGKMILFVGIVVSAIVVHADAPQILNVTAKQRYPWNGKVDITYEVVGDVTEGLPSWNQPPLLVVSATNRTDGICNVAVTNALTGDTGTAAGMHHVVWDLNQQGIEFKSDDVVFSVAYSTPQYCVVDLSAGTNATSYPVVYMGAPPAGGFNTDEYKTTKLVLRLIEPGSFMMCGQYDVTLTKPFYCGLFEVTQRQYEMVTGSNPSSYKGDMRPVECVSWNTIRGDSGNYNWPSSADVDLTTFMGRLQARTGLNFDLPTEAQWEYACRAGTTSSYNNGGTTEDDLKQLGRFWGNRSDGNGGSSEHTNVGSYLPNAWGLYDMHGNVWEWCLDWYGGLTSGVTDPKGSSSGAYRVLRGGSWDSSADCCTSSYRVSYFPSSDYYDDGFRLVRTLSD